MPGAGRRCRCRRAGRSRSRIWPLSRRRRHYACSRRGRRPVDCFARRTMAVIKGKRLRAAQFYASSLPMGGGWLRIMSAGDRGADGFRRARSIYCGTISASSFGVGDCRDAIRHDDGRGDRQARRAAPLFCRHDASEAQSTIRCRDSRPLYAAKAVQASPISRRRGRSRRHDTAHLICDSAPLSHHHGSGIDNTPPSFSIKRAAPARRATTARPQLTKYSPHSRGDFPRERPRRPRLTA